MSEELTWMPAWKIRELIGKADVSSLEVTEHFLGRIEQLDPQLKTFHNLDVAGARAQANRADEAVRRGDELGTLHGIPVCVKDISLAEMPQMGATGSPMAKRDALGVERLRQAGAIVFGTNTMMMSGATDLSQSSPGVFAGFNWDVEACNPWDTSRVPGWSSSGGASAPRPPIGAHCHRHRPLGENPSRRQRRSGRVSAL